jgi:hypothetical protein
VSPRQRLLEQLLQRTRLAQRLLQHPLVELVEGVRIDAVGRRVRRRAAIAADVSALRPQPEQLQ